ncbi:MAG TPA: bifunctional diaminohydroxyphosphoribosylaminopyrimidine deaminase/5-amino-6-(5-phosphoribosylamino)uracil reductase RibD, partial [Holophagaceae bacterium]|nr:bifunctional diaminohydroxyphosphoribosylaminopyrimidine deaminase/5-amino-6-(5-phosphoribosylamino)uracil reductase RibD [Holophagaceae bacterium]
MPELTPALAWELATGGPWPDPAALQGDEAFMAEALREGLKGVGLSSPNPPVGCVLVREGHLVGRGVHTRAGDPHGEIMALRDAEARGEDTRGATAYVTLEPCCHHGRTPPCTEALIQAGIARVVIGVRDPNPRVDGGGLAILRAHGVTVAEGVLGAECGRFHAPFFKLIRSGLPWVSLKLALGADG